MAGEENRPNEYISSVIGLGSGVVLGALLEKCKLTVPSVIMDQFLLKDWTAARVFLNAVCMSAVVFIWPGSNGRAYPKPLVPRANIIGGLLGGVGLALSGVTPDTVFAQIGSGRAEAMPALLGAIAGTTVYVYVYPALQRWLNQEKRGTMQLHELLGIPYATASVGVIVASWGALYALETVKRSWGQSERDTAYLCGLGIGAIQFASLVLMKTYFGTSAAYVTMVSHSCALVDWSLFSRNSYAGMFKRGSVVVWEVMLHAGCLIGARLVSSANGSLRYNESLTRSTSQQMQTFVGSAIMLFGVRLAGGCTSGHGISGIAQLSVGSLLTSLCFVLGGVPTAYLMRYLKSR